MRASKQIKRVAKQLLRLCMVHGFLDEFRVRQVVQLVLESKRRHGHILLSHFLRLVKLEHTRRTAEIESAASLPSDLRARVLAGLNRVYGPGLNTSFSQNPGLIGGLRIRVGSDVYDGSVKAGLAAVERCF